MFWAKQTAALLTDSWQLITFYFCVYLLSTQLSSSKTCLTICKQEVEVLPLPWFTAAVHPFIPNCPCSICEAPPSDSVDSGLPRTTYFTEYTPHKLSKLWKLIQKRKIYVLNIINYYPMYIPS